MPLFTLSTFTWVFSDCPTILILLGLSQFCLKIPNPNQYAIRIGKIPISTRVVIFLSNYHKRKRNVEYLTLMSQKTEENTKVAIKLPKIFYRNYCVRTREMVFQSL